MRKTERKEKRKEEKKEGERKMETVRPINPEDQSHRESLTGIEAGKSSHLANTQNTHAPQFHPHLGHHPEPEIPRCYWSPRLSQPCLLKKLKHKQLNPESVAFFTSG